VIGVDASVAAKWIFIEEYRPQARALREGAVASGDPIVAPALLRFEVTNIVRQRMRRERLPLPLAQQRLNTFLAVPVRLLVPEGLHNRALSLAETFELPAAYDAHYLALAEEFGYTLWTDDQRLLNALRRRLPFVRWIAEYSA
jgi:predicted nucleic acid-binding protein